MTGSVIKIVNDWDFYLNSTTSAAFVQDLVTISCKVVHDCKVRVDFIAVSSKDILKVYHMLLILTCS